MATAILAMHQEMDTRLEPDSGPAYPPDTVSSSSSTTNLGAQHRGMDTGAGPLTANQQRSAGIIEPSLLTTPSVTSTTQPITKILIPDLTKLITRCSPDPISGGTYGNIYKCMYHGPKGDAEVAVKAIRPQFFSAEMFRRELGIWKRLRHSNILKFMGTTSNFGLSVALVAPWMTNGTLMSFLNQNNETLRQHDRLLLLRDIAAGLNYLHTFSLTQDGHTDLNPIVHGDLTGTNVLIDGDRKAYLADFGLSGTLKKLTGMTYLAKLTCHPGAVRWAAPELLSGEESDSVATTQSDMYSFGNIMLQVLTGNVPWCHLTRDLQIMLQVIEGKTHPRPNDDYVSDRCWNFMTRCWSMTITDRPPAKEAVQFVGSALHTSTSPQSAALPLAAQTTATSSSKPPSSGMKGKENEKGGYRPKGRPKEEEMENESGEDNDIDDKTQVSHSMAYWQQRFQALMSQRALGEHIASQHMHTHVAENHVAPAAQSTAPIALGQPYNLPALAIPMTPRTTRRMMLRAELSESMRRQLLWEWQVNSTTNPAANARRANNGVLGGLQPLASTISMGENPSTTQSAEGQDRDERKQRAKARIKSWADDYHYSGW